MSTQPAIKSVPKQIQLQSTSPAFWQEVGDLLERLEKRAYELFEWRGRQIGNDLTDWLNAERELFRVAAVDITEKDNRVIIRVETPGFKAEELEIHLDADLLVVKGRKKEQTASKDEKTWYSESQSKQLFRRVVLPTRVDPGQAKATLNNGVLEISAAKAGEAKKIAVTAA